MPQLRSPNEMLAAAKDMMLNGRDPETKEDWQRVMNFFAANVLPEVAGPACRLMATMYDMPLTDAEVDAIVEFQQNAIDAADAQTS